MNPRQVRLALSWRLEWKKADCWIGVFWRHEPVGYGQPWEQKGCELHLWVCILPMLPLHLWWQHWSKGR